MKKILVVDDDKDILMVVDELLRRNNFIVKAINKWENVYKEIKAFVPDLLLIDIDLRGADGGEICKKLKQSKHTEQLPVILFSGLMPEEYLKTSGADGYLIKPFNPDDLLEIINHNVS